MIRHTVTFNARLRAENLEKLCQLLKFMLVFVFYAKMLKILKIKKIIPCGTPDFISQSAIKISTLAIFY